MMAHEVAHILLGDYFNLSGTKRLSRLACALLFLLVGSVISGAYVSRLIWVVPVILFFSIPFLLVLIWNASRRIYRQNDLLADSIAAKLTYDPGTLRKTLEKLNDLYLKNTVDFMVDAGYPEYIFVTRVRPEVIKERMKLLDSEIARGMSLSFS